MKRQVEVLLLLNPQSIAWRHLYYNQTGSWFLPLVKLFVYPDSVCDVINHEGIARGN